MKNIIIGTAGHIDHGKTSLIKALTGRNTDRWKEEQQRGITIDLGFTYFDLPGGGRAGIVDVPGHEKFIPHMAAGVVGMDLVLVVVAADEGMMPQTREHLDILSLLGIEKAILVLNKCDLVDEEWLELMEEEVREELAGTFMAKAPLVRVSAATGEGLPALVEEIVRMAAQEVTPKDVYTIPRLPVDRVFSLPGFGTIATGTLVSGRLSKETKLQAYPVNKLCKIRSIQVYGEEREEGIAGQRVALNLSNLKKSEVYRGCVLAPVNSMKNTSLLDVRLEMLPSSSRTLENHTRLHLFTGTSEVLCRAYLLDKEELAPGESGYVQLRLEEEIAVRRQDRFVVRFYSPMETIGGGMILEPNPKFKRRFRKEAIEELRRKESGSSLDVVEIHVKAGKEAMTTVEELAKLTALSKEEMEEAVGTLCEDGQVCVFPLKKDTYVWHAGYALEARERLQKALLAYEKDYPYRRGMKKAQAQSSYFCKIKPNVFSLVLEMWEREGALKREEDYLCTPDFQVRRDAVFERVWNILYAAIQGAGYDFLRYSEIPCEGVPEGIRDDIWNLLKEEEEIVKVSDDVYSLKSYMEEAADRIREMLAADPVISISAVRDAFSTSRKCAKLILEYTDSIRLTKKTGAESEWTAFSERI